MSTTPNEGSVTSTVESPTATQASATSVVDAGHPSPTAPEAAPAPEPPADAALASEAREPGVPASTQEPAAASAESQGSDKSDPATPENAAQGQPSPEADTAETSVDSSAVSSEQAPADTKSAEERKAPTAQDATPAAPTPPPSAPTPAPPSGAKPSPAAMAGMPHAVGAPAHPTADTAGSSEAMAFGRVADDGTVYVRTPDGEQEVGSYPGATPEEALSYFARKYDEVNAQADLLLQRVTQTDLASKDAAETLGKLRTTVSELRAVGDLAALAAKVENIATALEARRTIEATERAAAKEAAKEAREKIVAEAESIAGTEERKIQWKSASARMRSLLDEWKQAQRTGARLDRDVEQALWHRLSSARNSFDKLRRVHFAQLSATQGEAKARKLELVAEAEKLSTSTEWGATAGAFKRLMDQWRAAGRASRHDDDALWAKFKAAQDHFFAEKDKVAAVENEQYKANLAVKEKLLEKAQALLPVKDVASAKSALRSIQDEWDAAGKVPRADIDRMERGIRKVEQAVRDADQRNWTKKNPEVQARAQSMVDQLESAVAGLEEDLKKAQDKGDERKIKKAQEALDARKAWLEQARSGLAEFS